MDTRKDIEKFEIEKKNNSKEITADIYLKTIVNL